MIPPDQGGWQPVGPTGEPFARGYPVPRALDRHEIAGDRRRVPRRRRPRARGRLRRRRNPRRPRLPDSRVPLAARQHPHGRLRRVVRQPHAALPRGRRGRARRVARAAAAVRAHLGDRLDDGRVGHRAVGRAGAAAARARRRSGRLLVRRRRARRADSRRARAIRCRSRNASGARPAWRPAPSG